MIMLKWHLEWQIWVLIIEINEHVTNTAENHFTRLMGRLVIEVMQLIKNPTSIHHKQLKPPFIKMMDLEEMDIFPAITEGSVYTTL